MPAHAFTAAQLVGQPAIGSLAEPGRTTVSALEETFGATGTLPCLLPGQVDKAA